VLASFLGALRLCRDTRAARCRSTKSGLHTRNLRRCSTQAAARASPLAHEAQALQSRHHMYCTGSSHARRQKCEWVGEGMSRRPGQRRAQSRHGAVAHNNIARGPDSRGSWALCLPASTCVTRVES
jgi:hypothetical protein